MDQIPQWRFRKMQPGEINVDPIEGEFFTTEAIGSITDALVRESIQNSLDAAAGEGPVTICFSFHYLLYDHRDLELDLLLKINFSSISVAKKKPFEGLRLKRACKNQFVLLPLWRKSLHY